MELVIILIMAIFAGFMLSEYVLPSLPKKDITMADKYRIITEDLHRIEHTLASTKLSSSEAAELIEAAGHAANRGRSVREMIKHISVNE